MSKEKITDNIDKLKTLKISELIKMLEENKKEFGDVEVFMTNNNEQCFDGVAKSFVIVNGKTNEKVLSLLRNNDVIKLWAI